MYQHSHRITKSLYLDVVPWSLVGLRDKTRVLEDMSLVVPGVDDMPVVEIGSCYLLNSLNSTEQQLTTYSSRLRFQSGRLSTAHCPRSTGLQKLMSRILSLFSTHMGHISTCQTSRLIMRPVRERMSDSLLEMLVMMKCNSSVSGIRLCPRTWLARHCSNFRDNVKLQMSSVACSTVVVTTLFIVLFSHIQTNHLG